MKTKTVLIIGAGHIAYRVKKLVVAKGYEVKHIANLLPKKDENVSAIDTISERLRPVDLLSLSMIYILDEEDENNLETVIALIALQPDIPIVTSLFNENIRPHLEAVHPGLHILNPARIAATVFVEALYQPLHRTIKELPAKNVTKPGKYRRDSFLKLLILSFICVILLATAYFHFHDGFSWINSFYFVIVTVATVGYGDINLQHASVLSKLVGIALILTSTVFIWLIFSLTIDSIIKRRVQRAMGRKKYNYKNHIILCGLGRLGYWVAEELNRKGEKVVIIESNEDSPNIDYFRNRGIDVYIGNARLPRVLQDVGVAQACALFSVISDDYSNLEVGLNARSFQPGLRLILRIFDESMAKIIKEKLDIHLSLSMSAIVDETFAARLNEPNAAAS